MKPRPPPISYGKSPKCGATADECNLYSLAARTEALHSLESANYGVPGTTVVVFAGARFRLWTGISKSWKRRLSAIFVARNHQHVDFVYLDIFRHCHVVGPAIWVLKRNAGSARTSYSDYARADIRWCNGGCNSSYACLCSVPARRVSPCPLVV